MNRKSKSKKAIKPKYKIGQRIIFKEGHGFVNDGVIATIYDSYKFSDVPESVDFIYEIDKKSTVSGRRFICDFEIIGIYKN